MKALCLQYTAFKEMLNSFAGNNFMPTKSVEKHSEGKGATIEYGGPFPSDASEAYLFMPLGYWPLVYGNTMYPDDFPTNLLTSMSSGATTTSIPGTYADGRYLMFFCVNEEWRKVSFTMKDGELVKLNGRDLRSLPDDVAYRLGSIQIPAEIDVNPAYFSYFPSEIEVKIHGKSSLDSELTVKKTGKTNLNSEITVIIQKDTSLPTEMYVWHKKDEYFPSYICVLHHSQIPSELTVKKWIQSNLPSEIDVSRHANSYLPSELVVICHRDLRMPAEITVKHIGFDKGILSEIYAVGKKQKDIESEIEIPQYKYLKELASSVQVVRHESADLPGSVSILPRNLMEAIAASKSAGNANLSSEILVPRNDENTLLSELHVVPNTKLESIANTIVKARTDISSNILVIKHGADALPTVIYVEDKAAMEALISDARINGVSALPSEVTIANKSDAVLPSYIFVTPENWMEVFVEQTHFHTDSRMPSEINVAINKSFSLSSEIVISRAAAIMKTNAQFQEGNYSAIPSEMMVVYNRISELPSEMMVAASNQMEAKTFYRNNLTSDLLSEITLLEHSDILSEVYVQSDPSHMQVHGLSIEPHLVEDDAEIVKDASGYSITPTRNYGKIADIYAAKMKGAEFYTTLGFDLSKIGIDRKPDYDYFKYEVVQKAVLKLYVNRSFDEDDVTINVYQVPYDWKEQEIDYLDMLAMPQTKLVNSFQMPKHRGEIQVDVTSVFKDWNDKPDTYAFMLAVDRAQHSKSVASFSSREGKNPPRLTITHYSKNGNGNFSDIQTEIEVNPYKDLDSEIFVVEAAKSSIDAEIEIGKESSQSDLPSEVEIDGISVVADDLPSEIELNSWNLTSNKPSEIEIKYWNLKSELRAEIDVLRDFHKGISVYII